MGWRSVSSSASHDLGLWPCDAAPSTHLHLYSGVGAALRGQFDKTSVA
jgi:hypothetical protein